MVKARKLGALAPVVYCVEHEAATIYMEKVPGRQVKEAIHAGTLTAPGEAAQAPGLPMLPLLRTLREGERWSSRHR